MKVIITNLQKINSKKGEFHICHFVSKDGKVGTTFLSPAQSAFVTDDEIVPVKEAFESGRVFDLSFDQNGRIESLEPLKD